MTVKGKVLAVVVLAGAGASIHHNWERISALLGLGDMSPSDIRAIDLAKSDYNLDHYSTNYAIIARRMKQAEGVKIIGWRAEKQTETVYLVKYLYTKDGNEDGYYFEVDVAERRVRNVMEFADLRAKYHPRYATPR